MKIYTINIQKDIPEPVGPRRRMLLFSSFVSWLIDSKASDPKLATCRVCLV